MTFAGSHAHDRPAAPRPRAPSVGFAAHAPFVIMGAFAPAEEPSMAHEVFDRRLRHVREELSRAPSQALPSVPSAPPSAPDELLVRLRARLSVGDPSALRELAGLIAWRGLGWTPQHRRAVLDLLRTRAVDAIDAVIEETQRCGRADVIDDAVEALKTAARDPRGVTKLCEVLRGAADLDPKIAAARALGATPAEHRADAQGALEAALQDHAGEVREAAAWALVNLGAPNARPAIEAAVEREREEGVRATLQDALDALPSR